MFTTGKKLCNKLKLTSRDTDLMLDTTLYSSLFYLLASSKMYENTKKIIPQLKDRVLLHALVFALIFIMLQKLLHKY